MGNTTGKTQRDTRDWAFDNTLQEKLRDRTAGSEARNMESPMQALLERIAAVASGLNATSLQLDEHTSRIIGNFPTPVEDLDNADQPDGILHHINYQVDKLEAEARQIQRAVNDATRLA